MICVEIGDQIIRKGTNINIFIYAIHHDPSVYPNPEKFDPDRFADKSLIDTERSPFDFIPFSAGSRNCIGKLIPVRNEQRRLNGYFFH